MPANGKLDFTSQSHVFPVLRLSDGMREAIKQAARREGRSMNAQIVQHLRAIYMTRSEAQEGAA